MYVYTCTYVYIHTHTRWRRHTGATRQEHMIRGVASVFLSDIISGVAIVFLSDMTPRASSVASVFLSVASVALKGGDRTALTNLKDRWSRTALSYTVSNAHLAAFRV